MGEKKNKGGRPRVANPRRTTISFKVNSQELEKIKEKAHVSKVSTGHFCRQAALDRNLPRVVNVPAINREAWIKLSALAENLHRYAAAITVGKAHGAPPDLVENIAAEVQKLRQELRGGP